MFQPSDFWDQTTVGQIIVLLKQKPGLYSKEVFLALAEKGNKSSMQNVHKMLKRLVKKSVVTKKDLKYSLSPEWIKQFNQFADFLQK
ncbi:MAG: hypothetical protein V1777_04300 [Candidatus Micrarchaeota archaeon]